MKHNQMTSEEAKKIVCDMIKSSTGVAASESLVITVSSQWALVARQFHHLPNDSNFRQYILSEIWKCLDEPRGQQEDLERSEPIVLAQRLEEISGIHILEERFGFYEHSVINSVNVHHDETLTIYCHH